MSRQYENRGRDQINIEENRGNVFIQNWETHSRAINSNNLNNLLRVMKERVESRLVNSLHNSVFLNLGKENQPDQVKRPWDREIKIGAKAPKAIPDDTTIFQVFNDPGIHGKLLILGQPGAGKTTTLLDLAKALVEKAEVDSSYPIPILFNLSSWRDENQKIRDWMVSELRSKYQVGTKLGQQWVAERLILPLLDGLDEVAPERQESCVKRINEFLDGEDAPFYVVVCSRIIEYENYETSLHLHGAVYLKELSDGQIEAYLTQVGRHELWQFLAHSTELLNFVRAPLLLSVAVLAYPQGGTEQWQRLETADDQLRHLLDAYVERMLHRNIDYCAYGKRKVPSARQTRKWLVWLARQMEKTSQTEFLIEEMQPSMLSESSEGLYRLIPGLNSTINPVEKLRWSSQKLKKHLIDGLVVWLTIGVIVWITGGLISLFDNVGLSTGVVVGVILGVIIGVIGGLANWLISGLIFVLMLRLNSTINPVEKLRWSSQKLKKNLIVGVIWGIIGGFFGGALGGVFGKGGIGLIVGLIVELRGWTIPWLIGWLIVGLIVGLIGWLIFGLIFGLIVGLTSESVDVKTKPNQGIRRSGINGLIFGLIGWLILGLPSWPFFVLLFVLADISWQPGKLGNPLTITLVPFLASFLIVGLPVGLRLGGFACIQHFTLRLRLYRLKLIPWNYARFLDYSTERLFLQRVGGSYRFVHKMLQQNFASMRCTMKFEYRLNINDLKEANRVHTGKNILKYLLVCFGVFVSTSMISLQLRGNMSFQDILLKAIFPNLLMVSALYLVILVSQSFSIKRIWNSQPLFKNEVSVETSSEGLRITTPVSESKIQWPGYTHWRETPNLFMIYQSLAYSMILPKRAFISAEEVDEFRELLRAKLSNRV